MMDCSFPQGKCHVTLCVCAPAVAQSAVVPPRIGNLGATVVIAGAPVRRCAWHPSVFAGSRLGLGTRSQPSGRHRGRTLGVPQEVERRYPGLVDESCSHGRNLCASSGAERIEVEIRRLDLS